MKEVFWGREHELAELHRVDKQKKAALIVCMGRRRIGKSRLIQKFGTRIPNYIEISGLAPREKQGNQDQLKWFSKELARQTKIPEVIFKDWGDAFQLLANYCENKHILIFLDEISWMGHHDPDFPGKLKIAWDTHLKKNSRLRLVLCGSVSSWIQKNILSSTDFLGRISLEFSLKELSLAEARHFWGKRSGSVSALEKLRVLSLTGGVPRYLEEIDYSRSAEDNYRDLCFSKTGFLFSEFTKIFNDIFERRSDAYSKIAQSLVSGPKNLSEISRQTELAANGVLSGYLTDLELSGFLRKELMWDLESQKDKSKTIRYRLTDNYVRFYLKYIFPNSSKIEKGLFKEFGVEKLPAFDAFIGLQFENILLQNVDTVLKVLKISKSSVQNYGPFLQTATARKKGCQIDLLLQTKNTLYLCELKARRVVDHSVITEVQEKMERLKYPKSYTIRPILIYAGTVTSEIIDADYFHQIIDFTELLQPHS